MQVWVAGTRRRWGSPCDPWRCDFHSHGACVEFETDPPDLAVAKPRVDALLDRELPFWGLSNL